MAVVSHAKPRFAWPDVIGAAGSALGWLTGRLQRSLPTIPSLAGAGMVAYGASMIYLSAGFIAGGGFLLWIGTELHGRR